MVPSWFFHRLDWTRQGVLGNNLEHWQNPSNSACAPCQPGCAMMKSAVSCSLLYVPTLQSQSEVGTHGDVLSVLSLSFSKSASFIIFLFASASALNKCSFAKDGSGTLGVLHGICSQYSKEAARERKKRRFSQRWSESLLCWNCGTWHVRVCEKRCGKMMRLTWHLCYPNHVGSTCSDQQTRSANKHCPGMSWEARQPHRKGPKQFCWSLFLWANHRE